MADYKDSISKDENQGIMFGSLIAAGINAATGRNLGDGLLRALQGGSKAYVGGINSAYERKKAELEAERMQKTMEFQDSQMAHQKAMQPYEIQKMQQDVEASRAIMEDRNTQNRLRKETDYQNDVVGNLAYQRSALPMDYLKQAIPEQGGKTVDQILSSYMQEYKPGRELEAKRVEEARKEQVQKFAEDKADKQFKIMQQNANTAERRAIAAENRATETGGKADARMAMSLRKEFNALQPVKDYHEITTKFNVMDKAFEESKKTNNFVAVDQALITIYNKMTDPQSVVRESEYVRTPEDMAILNRVKAGVARISKGGRLEPDTRQALMTMAGKFKDVYNDKYNNIASQYEGYAAQSGLDPTQVIPKRQVQAPKAPTSSGRFQVKELP